MGLAGALAEYMQSQLRTGTCTKTNEVALSKYCTTTVEPKQPLFTVTSIERGGRYEP